MTRRTRAVVLLTVLAIGAACTKRIQQPLDADMQARLPDERNIAGLVLTDGTVVRPSDGRIIEIVGDTMIVLPMCCRGLRSYEDSVRIADVTHVELGRLDGRKTAIALLVPVGVVAVLALAVLASSCPFVYAYDGRDYVPVAEPLAGAITPGLERSELSALENIAVDDGMYRVILANEIDETQYIDRFHLLAIDHPSNTRVIPDRSGTPRVVGAWQPPLSVRDHAGTDLLPVLGANDEQWWPLDPGGPGFAEGRTRDTLTFTFPRPQSDSATLVVHARNSLWGAYMVKRSLQLWGSRVDEWYRLLDSSPATRQAQEEWVQREETWVMKLWVREDSGWRAQDVVVGGGPYMSELQSVAIDLAGVSGSEVEVRLHPPLGYWRIDFAALAGRAAAASVMHEMHPAEAVPHGAGDARALLRERDGEYLVLSEIGERVSLEFAAPPPPRDGYVRTVFSSTAGHYRVHTRSTGPRLAAQLDSLWLVPGFPVQFAEREYAAWQLAHPGVPLHAVSRAERH